MIAIQTANLTKKYGDIIAINGVDLEVEAGEIVGCLGPERSGKTTLLRILLGLDQPDSGSLFGTNCRWAAVFQEDRLLGHLDAEDNLRFALGSAYNAAAAKTLLGELGLADVGSKPICEYSGGMKRRLALARALLAPSDALILDEPFTGMDPQTLAAAAALLRERCAGRPTLLATHDRAAIAALGWPVIELEKQ